MHDQKNKARSRRYDYLPNRANKYSIRKFTVGTTSILIGATLVFGIDHDAKAAETTTPPATSTTTASDTTAQPATTDTTASTNTTDSTSTATSTAQSTTADSTTQSTDSTNTTNSTSTADTSTSASTAQSTTADSTTQSTDSTNATNSTSTADTSTSASTAQSTTADSTTQSTDSTNTTTSTSTADTSTSASTAQSTTADSTTQSTDSTNTTTSTSIADTSASTSTTSSTVATSTSTSTASASTASTTATSTSTSTSTTSSTTLSNFSLMSAAAPMAAAAVAPATTTDVVAEQNNIIIADAIANGYIKTATDATNAANTLSGRAWLIDSGTPATMANGLTPVPEGTPVYMQWIDTDGAVSPIYQASTTNQLSSVDGSQVGPGAYAFDLREPWVDANGTSHTYRAIDGQYYRLWINDFTTANGNTATMLRQAGGFYPDTFVNSVTGSNLGQFPLIGTNMQRTGIFMSIVPTNNYMTTNNWIVDNQGPLTNPSTTTSVNDFISGKVWLESGAGDYANSATGPNYNAPSDVAGAGYQVVMSSLTAEGAKAYDAYINSLPKDQQTAAARTLLQANPQYISATVTGYTDANGNYTLRFPSGALDLNHVYGYVLDPKGNLVKSYSAFTTPLFRPADANLSFTPQTAPYVRPVRHAWVNVNFAVVGTNLTNINITNFDVTANPAKPGDVAYVDVTTTALSPLPTYVEWRDSAGNVVQRSAQVTTEQEAEVAGTFTIPTNAKSGEVYTVYIVSGGNDIAADSLIVQVDQNSATYQPTYPTTTVSQGQTLVVNPPLNNDGTTLPTGTSFESGNNVPTWATVNADGSITVAPDAAVTPGSYNVPVVVTYPDGSRETVYAPVTVKAPDATVYNPTATPVDTPYGTATTADQVTSNVTIPGYPTTGPQPVISVNDPSQLPDGTTPGTVNVPVTVTYPDGSTDQITVPVTTGQPQATQFDPTVTPVNNPYGTATTADQVTSNVTIPGYPTTGPQPVITVNDPSQLPNGTTPGTVNVPVTVTYPDGSTDQITVPVTTGQPQATTYQPVGDQVNNPFGTPTTENQIVDAVIIPGYPTTGPQPVISVNDPSTLPDGQKSGTVDVSVTVTYPDGSTDQITVPVTTGNTQATQYDPTATPVTNPYGTPTTQDQVLSNVTVPGFPTTGAQPSYTLADGATLPDGTQSGTYNVPVVVTYPDGSKDTISVPVTVGDAQAVTYEPTATPIDKNYGSATSEADVVSAVTVPNFPTTGDQPTITVDDPTTLPDGQTPGNYNVPVTVTYPDGSQDHISVPITVGSTEASTYQPTATAVETPFGTPTTADEVIGNVTIPEYPTTGEQPVITVDDPTTLPDGQTPGNYTVPVTVTYPDGSQDHITVPVTVTPSQASTYNPTTGVVNNPYGTPTTEAQVTSEVTVTGYPSTGPQPVITVDNPAALPDGSVTGTVDVPVTITYPDGSVDHVTVSVSTGDSQAVTYEPTATPINKPYGTPTTNQDMISHVTIPGYPTTGEQPIINAIDPNTLPTGYNSGTFEVPVLVTYPDGTSDSIIVTVTVDAQPQNNQYEPVTSQVNQPYGTPTTETDVVGKVTIPGYPTTGDQPVITVDNPSSLPDGTASGTYDVPVTVTYPDGTTDHITVPVVVGAQPQNTAYEPITTSVEKPYGTPTTTDDITGSVTVPGYPTTGDQPVITVDNPSTLPDGTTPGTYDVPVTVTYPDGTTDHVTVPVTVGTSQATQFDPTVTTVNTPYGTPTTEADVVGNVTIPGYPTTGDQPVITVDNPSSLPDGTIPGTVDVPVTVMYPDGSVDKITVPVTTGEAQATTNEPTATPVENPYGTPTTVDDITSSVTVPGYPTTGDQPVVTVDNPSTLPDGTTPGTVDVPVTVTYPDGSVDKITVPVTTGVAQATTYEPTTTPVEKSFGTPTTVDDITSSVTVPGYSTTGDQPVITVDNPSTLPDGQTPGTYDVPVTVTYPDGSQDHTTVTVTVGESQATQYEPVTGPVNNSYGTPTTEDQVVAQVTVPNFPTTGEQPVITVDNPSSLPDGQTPGTVDVSVTVTYPDGTVDHTTVTVNTGDTQATQYEPTATPVDNPYGTPTTENQVLDQVTVPNYPTTGDQPTYTIPSGTTLPDGSQSGTFNVPVIVTYPDGSQDMINVPVTVGESQATTNEPTTTPVEKPFGTPTTVDDITSSVTVPGYPATGDQPVITVDNPSSLPDGTTPGTYEVPVTVT
ncbi:Rib/alpha-like domain-containing protein [Staphylococcus chromogenes]|uniref:Rib/alpha-like domain-containing protein n=1 Tax=Staphylococcus chromogenes TaxID=46126 RepID=UPI003AFFF119